MRAIRRIALALAIVLAFGYLGRMDYETELLEARFYCQQVKAGAWPDYQASYKDECED